MVYSPFYFFCGAHIVRKAASMYSWLVAPLDLPHTPPFLSLSLNLSLAALPVALLTCLTPISTSAFCNSRQNSS